MFVYFINLIFLVKCDFKFLLKILRVSGNNWWIDYVMEEDLDRCSEICYVIDKFVFIKVGLLILIDVWVVDLSVSGMKLIVVLKSEL